jgi:uncharacterized protein DUF4276
MVKRSVRVYIEGGARGKTADADFRRGWKKFLNELHNLAIGHGYCGLKVVRGTGRGNAYRRFKKHQTDHPIDLCVLLVDSEIAVPKHARVWSVVADRPGDKWQRPVWASERHLYLMVHFVETWLLTDQDALQQFFKRGLDLRALPTTNLEARSKHEIERALKSATQRTAKGAYQHGQAHEIIEIVRPDRVRTLEHGQRLFETLGRLIMNVPEPKPGPH